MAEDRVTEATFTGLFSAAIEKAAEDHIDAMANGSADDYAEYRQYVGHVAGLVHAKRILADLEERYLKQNEDEEEATVIN
ncbi:MAG TPA: hypothetical protein VMX15_04425 [Candidatus Heimdallarchaeota archaeon]|nr:hypothetical protein [Candidatus Heimdallarchaeota archaeon]